LDSLVFAAVLFAAACHAGWNAAIKIGSDTLSTTALIAIGAGIVGVALLPFVGVPAAAAWSWIAASVVIHLLYFIGLSEGYRVGDLGQVYPLARGTAPLMTATLSVPLVGEALGPLGWGGIFALASGVFLLSARGGHGLARFDARATGFALFTAITICAYSFVDGIGARLAGSAGAYTACLFIGNGVVLAAYAVARLRGKVFAAMAPYWGSRPCRRWTAIGFLRHCDLGHDGCADCNCRGPARDQRSLRGSACGCISKGAAAADSHCRGRNGYVGAIDDPAALRAVSISLGSRSASHQILRPVEHRISNRANVGVGPLEIAQHIKVERGCFQTLRPTFTQTL